MKEYLADPSKFAAAAAAAAPAAVEEKKEEAKVGIPRGFRSDWENPFSFQGISLYELFQFSLISFSPRKRCNKKKAARN